MDRAKKKIASAIDGLRNLHKPEFEYEFKEKITAEHLRLSMVARHGFPDDPRCIAYDPIQRLLGIGSGHGSVRVLGNIGVDYFLKHEFDAPVTHLQFLINEGALVTVCRDDMVHLWNFRQKVPEIVHSVQMNKERITSINVPFQSKWLHIGTERGNVYFVCVATFALSTYVINWNKAIDLACRTHPGGVQSISTCPADSTKILILYEKGVVVLWNLVTKEAERFQCERVIRSLSWHYDGRQFLCGCADGSLVIWNTKKPSEFQQKLTPHGQRCRSVIQVDWMHFSDDEHLMIFSGGIPQDEGAMPSLTILRSSASASVLEMDYPLIQFVPLVMTPFTNAPQQPFGIAALLKNDLLVIDLCSPGYPCFENINPMDLHESPVTFLRYYSDCPLDVIGALTLVGCKQRRQGYSEKPWPISGGTSRECASSHQELLLTGHEDGSVKFWQTTGENLQVLYKLKSGRHFERSGAGNHEFSNAVVNIELCLESRLLLIGGQSGQVTLFHFVKTESAHEIAVIHIPSSNVSLYDEEPHCFSNSVKELRRQGKAISQESSYSTDTSEGSNYSDYFPLKVRGGALRRPAGYQPELVCLIPWRNSAQSEVITSLALNSVYGIIAIGSSFGLSLVDIVQCTLISSWSSFNLYNWCSGSGLNVIPNNDLIVSELRKNRTRRIAKRFTIASQPQNLRKCQQNVDDDEESDDPSKQVSFLRRHYSDVADTAKRQLTRVASMNTRLFVLSENLSSDQKLKAQISPCTTKSFSRLNTDFPPRSNDRHPILSKAHSAIESPYPPNNEFVRTGSKSDSKECISSHDSRCSSPSSQDKMPLTEAVTSLFFIQSSLKKNDSKTCPMLWIGFSSGVCLTLNFFLPNDRISSTITAIPYGSVLRFKGQIICTAFLDQSLCLLSSPAEMFRDKDTGSKGPTNDLDCRVIVNKVLTKSSLSPSCSSASDYFKENESFQVAVVISEEEVRVLYLPAYNQLFSHKPEIPFVKATSSHVSGYPILFLLNAAGQVVVLSLPTLKSLLCCPLFKQSIELDDPVCQKISLSNHGLGMYLVYSSEIQKFTISAELAAELQECIGELFIPMDLPEPQKNSFFKGVSTLFVSQKESVDLDSIFADKSTGVPSNSGMRSVGRTILGPSANMEQVTSRNVTAGQAANLALQTLHERGEKLGATVDATERLKDTAVSLSQKTGKLVEKYEKKKWYNF